MKTSIPVGPLYVGLQRSPEPISWPGIRWYQGFIWGGKKPRAKCETLQLPKLKQYFFASQLRHIECWCKPDYSAKWEDMETNFGEYPIQSVIGDKKFLFNGFYYIVYTGTMLQNNKNLQDKEGNKSAEMGSILTVISNQLWTIQGSNWG